MDSPKNTLDGLAVPATATEMVEACKRALMEAQERILDSMSPEQLWQLLATVTQGGGMMAPQGSGMPDVPGRMQPDRPDPLARFILDESVRRNVEGALRGCTCTGQVATYCRTIYDEEVLPYEVLRGVDFHRAIMPLLGFRTTEAALKQAIIKKIRVA